MLVQIQTGPQGVTQSLSPSSQVPQRAGQLGETTVSQLHGRYYEQAYRRNIFFAANQAATTTTAGLAQTYTGLVLENPVGSPVNISILRVGYGLTIAVPSTAITIGLMCGFNSSTNCTHTASVTPASSFYGVGPTAYAKVDTSCASSGLPTAPVVTHILGSAGTGALTTFGVGQPLTSVDLDGAILLSPGAYCAFYTLTASGASGFMGSFTWEEIPL